ncbi:MAG TPA: hypothetical protein VN721_08590 [Flavipsychrobacter sp.]|nr:hypothetical protein [Flavipsychrobacter sp.]
MKVTKSLSLRPTLVSASVDFLKEEDMDCLITQDSIPELISQLFNYKEEGKALYPEIYIFDEIELIKQILTNSQFYLIGAGEKKKETMLIALKKCAPLAENGWAIYILRKKESFEFGVFRAGTSILSVSISEALIDRGAEGVKAILIHQVAEKLIEVRGIKANPLLISYGSHETIINSPIDSQLNFINTIVDKVAPELKEPTINFFRKVFLEVLQKGHGTLACVVSESKDEISTKFQDGIELQNRINIPNVIKELLNNGDLQANSKLEGQLSLIIGMLQSDGITVFTDCGEIVSYNVFVKHSPELTKTVTSGGARSRTFLTLCEMIGSEIKSAYIQSQDGKIEFSDGK